MSERQRANAPVRIGILFGGPSAEHDVSCASALGVARALAGGGYRTVAIGVTRGGGLRLVPEATLSGFIEGTGAARAIDDRLTVTGPAVELRSGPRPGTAVVTAVDAPGAVHAELDVVFPALHGPFGEDGVVQGLLESLGVPYVGCGILASAVGMDKVAMKRALRAEGVPITPQVSFDAATYRAGEDPEKLVVGLRRPLFVKPARMGSSIGISRVADGDDLAAAVEEALRHDTVVVVEQGVTGRELECGVLGGTRPEASAVGEVRVTGGWFDYRQKYLGDADPMVVPAQLTDDVAERIRELSVRAFAAIGGWGLARVDFLYDETAGELYVNELNTMPGFTAHSMYPKVWAAAGVGYREILDRLVALAFARHADRPRPAGEAERR
ncbi:D-alanine-D-alanine ligase [Micromonospora phaseoli]|uniref:D-alanine--D-alanine ligase n=1 Tax=Micromonospora phaseoli TaxID=1144548 RepID=A0A1H7A8J9_9ACTN|nr:D-alanine--D-alanine ligase family protein [Micromonospora phaseoli]PZV96946.1 D-alanine-D-alanine ligase [Micromonospora phaseoli]GIJ77922.1 D-alanine--D-alanine ligase [Micromonospora phaseoli]SEJ58402.1 D-alanine-D-alanine ligase [Micromonospora phaseoli]